MASPRGRERDRETEGVNERERESGTRVSRFINFHLCITFELLSIVLVAAECFPSDSIVVVAAAAELVPVILLDWLLNTF